MAPTTPSNTLVGTTGNDILTSPGSVSTLVQGLQGNDSISLNNAGDFAQAGQGNDFIRSTGAQFSGSIEAGEGNDFVTALPILLNGAYVGLNAGNDSINFIGSQSVNSTIGAGADNDILSLTGVSTFINSNVNAGKGADTVNLDGAILQASSIEAGEGSDLINATAALTVSANSYIGAGKGTDSITLFNAALGTVAGGGLNDTITFLGAGGASVIYGDANGVTTEGTGTGGAADGADLISFTAAGFASTTVYGAGANDTITFGAGSASGQIWGGNGADLIGNTAAASTVNAVTIDGGNGQDTIKLNAVANSALVLGGAGQDSIFLLSVSSTDGGSVNGGEGNDTISFIAPAVGLTVTASNIVTVNGGAGVDLVTIGGTFTALTGANSSLIGQVVYESGDSIQLGTALGVSTAAGPNWFGGAGQIFIASNISGLNSANLGANAGSIGVFDNGDDLVIGINSGFTSSFAVINVIGGDDAIKTTVVGAVNFTASNFGFSLAQSNGSLTITFS